MADSTDRCQSPLRTAFRTDKWLRERGNYNNNIIVHFGAYVCLTRSSRPETSIWCEYPDVRHTILTTGVVETVRHSRPV